MASVSGPFIALLDLVGGILLLLGVAGRWLGLLYAIEFAVAFFYVKLPAGFQGARLDLMLLAGGLLIFLAGPGKAALDAYWLETEGDRVTGSWSARPEESERGVRRPARLARPPSRHPRRAFRSLRNRRLARAPRPTLGKVLLTPSASRVRERRAWRRVGRWPPSCAPFCAPDTLLTDREWRGDPWKHRNPSIRWCEIAGLPTQSRNDLGEIEHG